MFEGRVSPKAIVELRWRFKAFGIGPVATLRDSG